LEDALPDDLSQLAGPLTGLLRTPAEGAVEQLVASDQFAELWKTANRTAHEVVVAVLRDETRQGISTAGGVVTLDLQPLVQSVGESVGVPSSALDKIPDDAGQITIFESGELADVQTAVQVLDFLSWFLFLLVVALYALAVFLARGDRPGALQRVGIGLIVGGVSVLLLRAIGVRVAVESFVADVNRPVGNVVADVATELLRRMAWTGIVFGVLIVAFAWLLGPHRWAVAARAHIARISEFRGASIVGSVLVVLLLLWWSPGRAFDSWPTALVLIAMAIGAVVVLLGQASRERADALHTTPSQNGELR
jgi:hypothetical protein